jgi:hypothetical protein
MRNKFKKAALTVMLATFTSIGVARADINPEQVARAYSDGYTGADGQFHVWEHRSDAESIRAHHADKYRPWRHDDPRHKDDR